MFLTAFWLRHRIWQLLRMSRFMKIGSLGTLFDGDFKDPKWTLLNTTWIPQLKITNTISLISYSSDLCLIEAF